MMPEDLKERLRAFNDQKVKDLIVGGYAFGVHAEPRATPHKKPEAHLARYIRHLLAAGEVVTVSTELVQPRCPLHGR